MIDIKIEQNDSKYYVLIELFGSYKLCKDFSTMEDALKFQEEFYLNICLFLMYGTDDKKELEKYAKKTYRQSIKMQYDYESYKNSLIGNLFSRKVNVNSSSNMEINGESYTLIDNINNISFIRNNIKYKYLPLDKIRSVLKKILLLKGKKQNGFNLTNLYWDSSISSQLCSYLFPELVTEYETQEKDAIRKYTSYYYGIYNNLLYGNPINIQIVDKNFIDLFFALIKCFKYTPYDLYLYRGASNDQKYCQTNSKYEYRTFISTSLSAPSTIPFANGEQYQLLIPKGTKVIFVGPSLDKDKSTENEVLLLPSKYTIENEKSNIKILKYQEPIDASRLFLDNLIKNRDIYIEQIGVEKYQQIYEYVLKKALEIKKQEIKELKTKEKKNSTIFDELALLFNYYGVYRQKENHELEHYTK